MEKNTIKSLYEKANEIYVEVGDVKVPTFISTETNYEIGFWGQRHKEYLKENHRVIYYNLLTHGKLNAYLHNIDIITKEQYDLLVKQLSKNQGVNEQLKVKNQMQWIQRMNNIANQAREIIYNDIIYTIH